MGQQTTVVVMNLHNVHVKWCMDHPCISTRHRFPGRGQRPLQQVPSVTLLISQSCPTPRPPLWDVQRYPDPVQTPRRGVSEENTLLQASLSLWYLQTSIETNIWYISNVPWRGYALEQPRADSLCSWLCCGCCHSPRGVTPSPYSGSWE